MKNALNNTFQKLSLQPRTVFLIDGIGRLISALFLVLLIASFEEFFWDAARHNLQAINCGFFVCRLFVKLLFFITQTLKTLFGFYCIGEYDILLRNFCSVDKTIPFFNCIWLSLFFGGNCNCYGSCEIGAANFKTKSFWLTAWY